MRDAAENWRRRTAGQYWREDETISEMSTGYLGETSPYRIRCGMQLFCWRSAASCSQLVHRTYSYLIIRRKLSPSVACFENRSIAALSGSCGSLSVSTCTPFVRLVSADPYVGYLLLWSNSSSFRFVVDFYIVADKRRWDTAGCWATQICNRFKQLSLTLTLENEKSSEIYVLVSEVVNYDTFNW